VTVVLPTAWECSWRTIRNSSNFAITCLSVTWRTTTPSRTATKTRRRYQERDCLYPETAARYREGIKASAAHFQTVGSAASSHRFRTGTVAQMRQLPFSTGRGNRSRLQSFRNSRVVNNPAGERMSTGRLSIAASFQAFNARRAVRYREQAERLREMAASEPDDILRDQLVRIAQQHDQLAARLDAAHQPNAEQRGRPH
jgi:hypothetical protein